MMTIKQLKFLLTAWLLSCATLLSGCATHVEVQPVQSSKARVPFGSYSQVVLVKSAIAPKYAEHAANIKAVNKIDELLAERLNHVFENLETISDVDVDVAKYKNGSSQSRQILLIKPLVKQVKFIGGAARFWVGAMAGSSLVVMDVVYEDAATGEVIAQAGFMRKGEAYSGAWSMGAADNRMLDDVAQDIVNYTVSSR